MHEILQETRNLLNETFFVDFRSLLMDVCWSDILDIEKFWLSMSGSREEMGSRLSDGRMWAGLDSHDRITTSFPDSGTRIILLLWILFPTWFREYWHRVTWSAPVLRCSSQQTQTVADVSGECWTPLWRPEQLSTFSRHWFPPLCRVVQVGCRSFHPSGLA